jgi:hypothetical protein
MPTEVSLTNIVGQSPFDIYVCQSGGTGCFYVETTLSSSISFEIPKPYDNANAYTIKIIDDNGCVIEKTSSV